MQIEDSFVVAAAPEQVWDLLLDVERVAPCMPGAQLTEVVDDHTWRGSVKMRLGPVRMAYTGRVVMVERDDTTMSVALRAEGTEVTGKGNASATVRSRVERTEDGGSRVLITQDLTLSGMAAQFGGRMIQDVSAHLTKQFAGCLAERLSEGEAARAAAGDAAESADGATVPATQGTRELPALRLALWALARAIGRALRLPWGRRRGRAATTSTGGGG